MISRRKFIKTSLAATTLAALNLEASVNEPK